jgi:hypothetical protein
VVVFWVGVGRCVWFGCFGFSFLVLSLSLFGVLLVGFSDTSDDMLMMMMMGLGGESDICICTAANLDLTLIK